MTKSKDETVCASSGDRTPAYANWYYISLVYILDDGSYQAVAVHSAALKRIKEAVKARMAAGKCRLGKTIGFGPTPDKLIRDYEVSEPTFELHPDVIVVRLKEDAPDILQSQICKDKHEQWGGPTREERNSVQTLKMLLGEEFAIVRDEDVPQMNPEQFWNTMPHPKAPAGFYLPKGLCEVVRQLSSASEAQIKRARDLYQTDDVEIDHNAKLSVADDGAWVGAWVWLPNENEEANVG